MRAKPGAPVSTPLLWEELDKKFLPEQFNIRTIFERIQKLGDLFSPILYKENDMESVLDRIKLNF